MYIYIYIYYLYVVDHLTCCSTAVIQIGLLVGCVGSILLHTAFTVYAVIGRDSSFGPLANLPNLWLIGTSWVPNLVPMCFLLAWTWKVRYETSLWWTNEVTVCE